MDGTTGSDTLPERLSLAGATLFLTLFPAALFLAPVPLAALHARHGLKYGIGTAVAASLLSALITLSPLAFAQSLLFLGLGIALGEGIRDGLSPKQILSVGTLAAFGATVALAFTVERVAGVNLFELIRDFWEEALERMLANDSASSPEMLEQWRALIREEIAFMERTLPASLFLGSLSLAAFDFALTRRLLERLPGEERGASLRLPPFARWRFGMGAGIGLLLGWLLQRWFVVEGPLASILLNVMLVLTALVALQGAATLWHWLGRTRLSRGWRIAIAFLVLILLFRWIVLVFAAVGLLDMLFDVRRLGRKG